MLGFKNANVYVEGKGIIKTNLQIFGDKIAEISENAQIDQVINIPSDAVVLPGFIDEHIHGSFGYDTMDASVIALENIAKSIASEGTTSFLATTMTQSRENIKRALNSVRDYMGENKSCGARLLGVHLEGPFISPKYVGAQPPEFVEKPCIELFDEFNLASGNNIKILTVAPEIDGANELISHLKNCGVVPSVGHSGASYRDIKLAKDSGLKSVTHTYNAQTGLHHREVGVVGAVLLDDELYAELICDTIHVCPEAIKIILKNKPKDKVVLITDAMRAKNLGDGESELGGQKVFVSGGEARLSDGTLAGSVLKMNVAIKNLVEKVGVDFVTAVDYATKNPAQNIGIFDAVGSIRQGKKADLTVLSSDFSVILTIRDGKVVYSVDGVKNV